MKEKTSSKYMAEMRKRTGSVNSKDPLVDFLYHILRDHLPAGAVEGILHKYVVDGQEKESLYTNGYLANYAKDLAERLRRTYED